MQRINLKTNQLYIKTLAVFALASCISFFAMKMYYPGEWKSTRVINVGQTRGSSSISPEALVESLHFSSVQNKCLNFGNIDEKSDDATLVRAALENATISKYSKGLIVTVSSSSEEKAERISSIIANFITLEINNLQKPTVELLNNQINLYRKYLYNNVINLKPSIDNANRDVVLYNINKDLFSLESDLLARNTSPAEIVSSPPPVKETNLKKMKFIFSLSIGIGIFLGILFYALITRNKKNVF